MFPILVSCLDLGNFIFDPVDVIFNRSIAIFTICIVVFDLDIAIFGLGIAQLNSQSIRLTELSRFEITPPNDRPRLLRSALPQSCVKMHGPYRRQKVYSLADKNLNFAEAHFIGRCSLSRTGYIRFAS